MCIAGYEGYIRHGSKGAVAVYHDDSTLIDSQALSYTTLEELLNDERMNDDIRGQLTERVTSYGPDFEVAVLFAYNGKGGLSTCTYSAINQSINWCSSAVHQLQDKWVWTWFGHNILQNSFLN